MCLCVTGAITMNSFGHALNIETLVSAAERRDTPIEVCHVPKPLRRGSRGNDRSSPWVLAFSK